MTYWRLFYHIVWTTRGREPCIRADVESDVRRVIGAKATELGGIVHAIGGTEDHVHLVASVPPRLALSEFVRQIKGSSSHFANHALGLPEGFAWQAEYGIMSFGEKHLGTVVAYVANQRQHHAQNTAIPVLERSDSEAQ